MAPGTVALYQEERKATYLHHVCEPAVPGLLQISEYTRDLVGEANLKGYKQRKLVERIVDYRLDRQEAIFSQKQQPELFFRIGEIALQRGVGNPFVMWKQMRHLLEMSKRKIVNIKIIPSNSPPHAGMSGIFTVVLKRSGYALHEETPCGDVVFADDDWRDQFFTELDKIDGYEDSGSIHQTKMKKTGIKIALSTEESRDRIQKAIDYWETEMHMRALEPEAA
jgi:hypothetical protein